MNNSDESTTTEEKTKILSEKTKESVRGIHAAPHSHSAITWIHSNNALKI